MSIETDWLVPSVLEALVSDGIIRKESGGYVVADQVKADGIIEICRRYLPKEYQDVCDRVVQEFIDARSEAKEAHS